MFFNRKLALFSILFAISILAVSFSFAIPANAQQTVVYKSNFASGADSHWSTRITSTTPSGRPFLGIFGYGTQRLTLNNLPLHAKLSVSFTLFVIDTWDGNNSYYGPSLWDLSVVGGPTLLHTTFSNAYAFETDFAQAFPGNYPGGNFPGLTGAMEVGSLGYYRHAGYQGIGDSVYKLTYDLSHTNSSIQMDFSYLPPGFPDDIWGLESVQVSVSQEPVVSNVNVSQLMSRGATVTWTSSVPANSVVEYGETDSYGQSASNPTLTKSHSITLIGLTPATLYHYRVSSTDSSGHTVMSPDGTFATFPGNQAIPQCTYSNLSRYFGGYAVDITMFNAGDEVLALANVNGAALGAAGLPSSPTLPYSINNLYPGQSTTFTLFFPASAGASGRSAKLSIAGFFTVSPQGFSLGNFSFPWRVILP